MQPAQRDGAPKGRCRLTGRKPTTSGSAAAHVHREARARHRRSRHRRRTRRRVRRAPAGGLGDISVLLLDEARLRQSFPRRVAASELPEGVRRGRRPQGRLTGPGSSRPGATPSAGRGRGREPRASATAGAGSRCCGATSTASCSPKAERAGAAVRDRGDRARRHHARREHDRGRGRKPRGIAGSGRKRPWCRAARARCADRNRRRGSAGGPDRAPRPRRTGARRHRAGPHRARLLGAGRRHRTPPPDARPGRRDDAGARGRLAARGTWPLPDCTPGEADGPSRDDAQTVVEAYADGWAWSVRWRPAGATSR